MMRVAIVDDHQLFAETLALSLSAEGYEFKQVEFPPGEATPSALLQSILQTRPDIVLLDLNLGPFGDGARLIEPLVRAGASVAVITASPEGARWGECLARGALQVLSKGAPLREIILTIRRIGHNGVAMAPRERERLVRLWSEDRVAQAAYAERLARLTRREAEILDHLIQGRTVREIAERSVVSESTVRTQVKSILAKLGVSSQLRAVGLARLAGWHPPAD